MWDADLGLEALMARRVVADELRLQTASEDPRLQQTV